MSTSDIHSNKKKYFFLINWINIIRFEYLVLISYLTGTVVSLCHQYKGKPVCTSMQSEQALYYWLTNFQVLILGIPKNNNVKWIIPFKKSGRLSGSEH